jgi:hypothetical protein
VHCVGCFAQSMPHSKDAQLFFAHFYMSRSKIDTVIQFRVSVQWIA